MVASGNAENQEGLGVALAVVGDPFLALDLQRRMEALGHTTKILEAWSLREARRLHVLLVGMLRSEAYAHDLRPFLPRPHGWFSLEVLRSGEAEAVIRNDWGVCTVPPSAIEQ